MWHHKECIQYLSLVLGTELQKPLEFPKWLSYANEINRGGLLRGFKIEAGQQRDQICDQEVGTLDPLPSEEGKGMEIEFNLVANDGIDYACVRKC